MKIGFDHQAFAMQSYGGISRYVVALATHLKQLQQSIRVVAPIHRNRYVQDLPEGVFAGREFNTFPPRSGRLIARWNRAATAFDFKRWKPDLVHETYYAYRSASPRSTPTVVTVHDMTHEKFPESFNRFDESAAMKRAAVARADHIICISESTKRDLIELLGTPEEKISTVYHGYDDLPNDGPMVDVARERPYLLYVGSRANYKNFSGLLKAVAASPRLKKDFCVIAFGGGALTGEERSLMTRLGLKHDQVLSVRGEDASLGAYYTHARAFVYPSRYEGFGLPPLEAMANGCPVITSNSSSLPEVVANAGAYFSPDDVEQIRHVIESTVYDDDRLAQLRALGRERLTHFSWTRCAEDTLNAYRRTLGVHTAPPDREPFGSPQTA